MEAARLKVGSLISVLGWRWARCVMGWCWWSSVSVRPSATWHTPTSAVLWVQFVRLYTSMICLVCTMLTVMFLCIISQSVCLIYVFLSCMYLLQHIFIEYSQCYCIHQTTSVENVLICSNQSIVAFTSCLITLWMVILYDFIWPVQEPLKMALFIQWKNLATITIYCTKISKSNKWKVQVFVVMLVDTHSVCISFFNIQSKVLAFVVTYISFKMFTAAKQSNASVIFRSVVIRYLHITLWRTMLSMCDPCLVSDFIFKLTVCSPTSIEIEDPALKPIPASSYSEMVYSYSWIASYNLYEYGDLDLERYKCTAATGTLEQ